MSERLSRNELSGEQIQEFGKAEVEDLPSIIVSDFVLRSALLHAPDPLLSVEGPSSLYNLREMLMLSSHSQPIGTAEIVRASP